MAWKRYNGRKYGNKKVIVNGIEFDSKKEAMRYQDLMMLEKAGIIQNLELQHKFVLIPAQREPDIIGKRGGKKPGRLIEKECSYIADFVYMKDGKVIVEDTKGFRTKDYIIKRKLLLWVHGLRINEI